MSLVPPQSSVFVSHASRDRDFVERDVIPFLQELGLSTWYSRDDILVRDEWERKLLRGLEACDFFLLVMSPNSAESEWVQTEVHWAVKNRWGRVILVMYQDCEPQAFNLKLIKLEYADFREAPERARQRLAGAFGHSWPVMPRGNPSATVEISSTLPVATVPAVSVKLPKFHCGGIVPPEFFIGRQQELDDAEDIIRANQSFLLVGVRRSGKSSFMRRLQKRLVERPDNTILSGIVNLEACSELTIETFLAHTILNMIGEMCREVFRIKPADLSRPQPAEVRPELARDPEFNTFVNINRQVVDRTYSRKGEAPSPFLPHEFVGFAKDLLDIIHNRGWDHYVVFYDEANHLPAKLSVELLEGNLEALNSASLTSVYAASPEMPESFHPLHELFGHQILIGPFDSQRDLVTMLTRYYYGDQSQSAELPISADALQTVWDLARGMPFQMQFLLSFGFQNARQQKASLVVQEHVVQAHDALARQRPEYFGPRPTR